LCRINPLSLTSRLDFETATAIVRKARELLRLSVHAQTDQRSTTQGKAHGSYWVYRRSGRACRICGDTVRMQRQGSQQRSTYYCAVCQSRP
jgi:formamidopyrimidine-DNA glycosylase